MKYLLTALFSFLIFSSAFSQSQNKELVYHIRHNLNNCDFYEVTGEMFKLISEDERYQNEEEIHISKRSNILFMLSAMILNQVSMMTLCHLILQVSKY